MLNRREFLAVATAGTAILPATLNASFETDTVFRERGYYTLGNRYPTAGLEVWKNIIDCMRADNCNLLIHWIAGAFKSKKYPDTWAYNADHENIKSDFTKEMIDYAHKQGIRVVLGFTPYGYDGVNQHTNIHPELIATGQNGQPVGDFGIHCWGKSLCPAKPASQEFLLEYIREMAFDFYPNADGLFIESSDYSTCCCEVCSQNNGAGHFEQEFQFVKTISDAIWTKNPKATIIVYPHYFSGTSVEYFGVKAKAASMPFDNRWTLFFTPHSTAINAELIKKATSGIWWDPALIFGTPESVKQGALTARQHGLSGYVPSLEAYSYMPTRTEGGEPWTATKRQVPFGIGWVPDTASSYDSLPIRTVRIAYREFSRNPDLSIPEFKTLLGREVFGENATPQHVNDLLLLQQYVNHQRDWALPSPVVEPLRVKWFVESGQLPPERRIDLRQAVENMLVIAKRYAGKVGAEGELATAAQWIGDQWIGENAKLLGLGG